MLYILRPPAEYINLVMMDSKNIFDKAFQAENNAKHRAAGNFYNAVYYPPLLTMPTAALPPKCPSAAKN